MHQTKESSRESDVDCPRADLRKLQWKMLACHRSAEGLCRRVRRVACSSQRCVGNVDLRISCVWLKHNSATASDLCVVDVVVMAIRVDGAIEATVLQRANYS